MTKRSNIRLYGALTVICAMLAAAACTNDLTVNDVQSDKQLPETENVAQEVLVKFAPYVGEILEKEAATRSGAVTRSGVMAVDEVLELIDGYELTRVFPVDSRNEERTREAGMHLWYRVRFGSDCSVENVVARLSQLGEVQTATPNRVIKRAYNTEHKAIPLSAKALEKRTATRAAADGFNDPLLADQWHLINRGDLFSDTGKSVAGADVNCEDAWKRSTGDPSIIVAVLDEGVCVTHPDLAANMWHNEGEEYRSRQDNDGNGYAGDYYGYNFVHETGIISWDNIYDSGHATHVAGVIAALNNNGEGISSIAGGTPENPGVKIMTCQIFSGSASGSLLAMVKAIKYAADNGAVVLQCSWGYVSGRANEYEYGERMFESDEQWELYDPIVKEALDYFTRNAGSPNGPIDGGIAVFASGNESAPMAGYPGAHRDYVAVAATAADYTPAVYTNYGDGTTISAPGGDQDYYYEYGGPDDEEHGNYGEIGCILSTLPYTVSETGYGYMEGTSMACPHVSGVVALGLSYAMQLRKHFTAEEFKALIYETAHPFDDYLSGIKQYYRYVADIGPNQMMQMTLGEYRNRMGAGQIDAGALLEAIEGSGRPITFPNVYVALESETTLIPGNYFNNGDTLTYTVKVEDETIAVCEVAGNKLIVRSGSKAGSTAASVTASDGTVQNFVITVRSGASDKGWL